MTRSVLLAHTHYQPTEDALTDDPVVLLGSLGQPRQMWDPLMAELPDVTAYALDLRGHGESPAPEGDYTIAELAGDVLHTMDELGVQRAHILGLSLGGAVAQYIAAHAPERVSSVILQCTALRFGTPQAWRDKAATVAAQGTAPLADATLANWFTPDAPAVAVDLTRQRLIATPRSGYVGCCAALAAFDGEDLAAHITAPTLVQAALQDGSTPPSVVEDLHDALTATESLQWVAFDPGAHLVAFERPEAVSESLHGFLAGL